MTPTTATVRRRGPAMEAPLLVGGGASFGITIPFGGKFRQMSIEGKIFADVRIRLA
ncbi:hypothetical protein GCM10017556_29330 [Micromonospora sagamiensis]|nr:hypothetical protein GCM10017556_29330 [Micromonospora sagamiensis]